MKKYKFRMWHFPENTILDSKKVSVMKNRLERGLLQIKVIKKTKTKAKKRKIKKQMYSANLNWIQYVKHL